MQLNASTIGRFLFALPMAVFGLNHFMKAQSMKGLVPAFIPGDAFWVYLTGAGLLAAAISIMIKKQVWLSTLLLAIMLAGFVLTVHIPGIVNGQGASAMIGMLKDIALAGGALFIGNSLGSTSETAKAPVSSKAQYE